MSIRIVSRRKKKRIIPQKNDNIQYNDKSISPPLDKYIIPPSDKSIIKSYSSSRRNRPFSSNAFPKSSSKLKNTSDFVAKPVIVNPTIVNTVITKPVITKPVITKPVITKPIITKQRVKYNTVKETTTTTIKEKFIVKVNDKDAMFLEYLGGGTYGRVYSVKIGDSDDTKAIKIILDDENMGIKALKELDIMGRLMHPNVCHSEIIVTVDLERIENVLSTPHGIDGQTLKITKQTGIGMISPKAIGDLFGFFNKYVTLSTKKIPLSWKLKLFHDICSGVNFLHSIGFIHLDIKPENILIFNDKVKFNSDSSKDNLCPYIAQIADFGQGLYLPPKSNNIYYDKQQMIDLYSPPELHIKNRFTYDTKSDIWSLGMLLLDIILEKRSTFNNSHMIRTEILTRFSEEYVYNTINNIIDPVIVITKHYSLKEPLVDLLVGMLSPHKYRATLSQILNHSIFSSNPSIKLNIDTDKCVTGILYCEIKPIISRVNITLNEKYKAVSLIHYYMFDRLFRACNCINSIKVETVFLAADILHRIVSIDDSSSDSSSILYPTKMNEVFQYFETNWKKYSLDIATSIWIACKLTDHIPLTCIDLSIKVFNSIFTSDELKLYEIMTVGKLNGVLYSINLYTSSENEQKLCQAFEYLRNIVLYPLIDLNKWSTENINVSDSSNVSSINFSDFLPKTNYYYLSNKYGKSYITDIFEYDMQRYFIK